MTTPVTPQRLEEQIERWRSYLRRRQAIHAVDIAELEDHLREQVAGLMESGLSADEAFLVAVKRMGDLDSLSREFAAEHSERLWKQLVLSSDGEGGRGGGEGGSRRRALTDGLVALAFAIAAGVAVKLPAFFGVPLDGGESFYGRNVSLLVLPMLTGYFIWKRQLTAATVRWLALAFVAGAVVVNSYPFVPEGSTEILAMLHLPIALWLVVGMAYAGRRWGQMAGRMDLIRFTGELFIYFVLIALGGGVFTGFVALLFQAIGMDPEVFFQNWLLPCGAAGAVVVAAWLVEAKQGVIENMAPVLTRLFTPLFTILLITFLVTVAWTGRGLNIERDLLIASDLLLVLVLGLLLYSMSARDPQAPPGAFDVLQVVLVVSALLVDAVALWAIAARISEFGLTPNRVAALGENVILFVNLAWSVVLYVGFLRGRGDFDRLERWQTNYLPVYAGWAALVVIVFPPLFGYA